MLPSPGTENESPETLPDYRAIDTLPTAPIGRRMIRGLAFQLPTFTDPGLQTAVKVDRILTLLQQEDCRLLRPAANRADTDNLVADLAEPLDDLIEWDVSRTRDPALGPFAVRSYVEKHPTIGLFCRYIGGIETGH